MCIYSPMPHTLSYCALIGKCALIRSNTVFSNIQNYPCNPFLPDIGTASLFLPARTSKFFPLRVTPKFEKIQLACVKSPIPYLLQPQPAFALLLPKLLGRTGTGVVGWCDDAG